MLHLGLKILVKLERFWRKVFTTCQKQQQKQLSAIKIVIAIVSLRHSPP